ncbi:MAG: glutamine-hydrolyzing GMP synthase, partial [Desulfobacterales bacterium]|nr:glutamine-hydrolyzing GMP synthase [Desulfobacterales bacterium]
MILIIDFGSQYNQLIARRVREHCVYCRIEPPRICVAEIKALAPEGIILSGGPSSIYEANSPRVDIEIFDLGIPVLGICYGMQYMVDALGGEVKKAEKREYGLAELRIKDNSDIFYGIKEKTNCWMSHGDTVGSLPNGFRLTASTASTLVAAIENPAKKLYGLQFHPEVDHTPKGKTMLKNFMFATCGCRKIWTMKSFIK